MKITVSTPLLLLALAATVSFSSCKDDKEEEITPKQTNPQTQQCDTQSVTYSGTVVSILNASCNSCHNTSMASGGVVLDTHAGVRQVATNGRLMGAITHSSGFSPMPQGGAKLSDCNIAKIKKWVDSGAANN